MPKGRLQVKSYNDVCLKIDCKQNLVMMFSQKWIAKANAKAICVKVDVKADCSKTVWKTANKELQKKTAKRKECLMLIARNS